jgi:hypothetical protein
MELPPLAQASPSAPAPTGAGDCKATEAWHAAAKNPQTKVTLPLGSRFSTCQALRDCGREALFLGNVQIGVRLHKKGPPKRANWLA